MEVGLLSSPLIPGIVVADAIELACDAQLVPRVHPALWRGDNDLYPAILEQSVGQRRRRRPQVVLALGKNASDSGGIIRIASNDERASSSADDADAAAATIQRLRHGNVLVQLPDDDRCRLRAVPNPICFRSISPKLRAAITNVAMKRIAE